MVVKTETPLVRKAREGVMEFMLVRPLRACHHFNVFLCRTRVAYSVFG